MSPELQAKLKNFGWTPGRQLDEARLHAWLRTAVETYDCHIFPEAVRIIREFGELTLWDIHMNPVSVNGVLAEPELWWSWEWEMEQILFPIGADTYATLYAVATDGKIYSEGLAGPTFHAPSFLEFLEIMARGERYKTQVELVEIYEKRKSDKSDEIFEEVERIYGAVKRHTQQPD